MKVPSNLVSVIYELQENGATVYVVGGAVRDYLLGEDINDWDFEVHDLDVFKVHEVLSSFDGELVGESFGVFLCRGHHFSLPRTERKIQVGHSGFETSFDPFMGVKEAASRRDFTINALYWDIRQERIIDYFDGEKDLKSGLLCPVGSHFKEDPLRILRAVRFISRFGFDWSYPLLKACYEAAPEFPALAGERVWEEWWKWANTKYPAKGLWFLYDTGLLGLFPELEAMKNTAQSPEWHPEGDVMIHSMHVVNEIQHFRDPILNLSALCHDMGKPKTTIIEDGQIKSPGHAHEIEAAANFLKDAPNKVRWEILELHKEHMFLNNPVTRSGVRRLLARLKHTSPEKLHLLMMADAAGRPPSIPNLYQHRKFLNVVLEVKNQVEPILQGRHLIGLGLKPGPHFGPILQKVFEAQLEGDVTNLGEAISLAGNIIKES